MTRIAAPGQLTALGPARPLSERNFQTQIRGLLRQFHWDLVFHAPSVLTMSERGWPDLVAVRIRDRRLLFAELKAERGRLTERQEEVLEILRAIAFDPRGLIRVEATRPSPSEGMMRTFAGLPRIEVHVWRPSQWDAIVEVLR